MNRHRFMAVTSRRHNLPGPARTLARVYLWRADHRSPRRQGRRAARIQQAQLAPIVASITT